ncbi:MAG: aldo/keto reductase [Aigarchaeota archaeon]|nr:aldo/keto reductase [Aigarchaeota archaeon]
MEFRRIGKTDFFLPVLGFGTWEIGGRDYPDYSNNGQAIEVIRYAIRRGIKFIDTAEMYGAGHAEEIVGEAISTFPREEVFIATKVWPYNLRYKDFLTPLAIALRG